MRASLTRSVQRRPRRDSGTSRTSVRRSICWYSVSETGVSFLRRSIRKAFVTLRASSSSVRVSAIRCASMPSIRAMPSWSFSIRGRRVSRLGFSTENPRPTKQTHHIARIRRDVDPTERHRMRPGAPRLRNRTHSAATVSEIRGNQA